jgi:hypothetical protein
MKFHENSSRVKKVRQTHGLRFFLSDTADELLQVFGHFVGQGGALVVEVRSPTEDLVQLEENARCAAMVVVEVLLDAWRP